MTAPIAQSGSGDCGAPGQEPGAEEITLEASVAAADGSSVEPSADLDAAASADIDYDPEREVDDDIEAITSVYNVWSAADAELSAADARSTASCHRALAEIVARSLPTDEDAEKRQALIDRVREHPEVMDSERYKPSDHSAADLHLTLQFGLKHRRGVKSNWSTAAKATEIALANGTIKVRSVEAIIDWFKRVGMKGAREIVNGIPGGKADAKRAALERMQGVPFELPIVWGANADVPQGLALMVIRFPEEPSGEPTHADFLGLVVDETAVSCAWSALLRQQKRKKKEGDAWSEQELESRDTDRFPANLVIPKQLRHHFDGRTHYDDEDERNEFFRQRKLEQDRLRKARGGRKTPKTQRELARKGRGKMRLPAELWRRSTANSGGAENPASPAASEVLQPADTTPPLDIASDVSTDEHLHDATVDEAETAPQPDARVPVAVAQPGEVEVDEEDRFWEEYIEKRMG